MGTIDAEQEHHRLIQLYARMSDVELQKLAEDAASLTDVARQALQNEVVGRGLNITLQDGEFGISGDSNDPRKPVPF
jgi:hypothetical protein